MAKFSSIAQVAVDQLKKLKDLSDANLVLRRAALDGQDAIQSRIQQSGKDGDNRPIISKSAKKYGAYSKSYGKDVRAKKGFQTQHVDLTFSGGLWSSWRVMPISRSSIGLGFFGDAYQLSGYIKKTFKNRKVFDLTKDDVDEALRIINEEVNRILQA